MKGTQIIVSPNPKGVFKECIVNGTPYPGIVMEMDPGVAADARGRHTWQAYGTDAAATGRGVGNDGDRKVVAVLVEKKYLDGSGIYSTQYADGDPGMLYFPVAGEDLNMMIENQSGTGESFSIGDECMVDDGTGKMLEADSNAEAQPFICMETQSALTADVWSWMLFAGHQ